MHFLHACVARRATVSLKEYQIRMRRIGFLAVWLSAQIVRGDDSYFDVSEILVYTGIGPWAPGRNGSVYYRLGCGGRVIPSAGMTTFHLSELTSAAQEIESQFGLYFQDDIEWLRLDASIEEEGRVTSDSRQVRFTGCSAPDLIELLYTSTNGWEVNGLTVVLSDGSVSTFVPDSAFPKLFSPYDDYDSLFLDLDTNFSDWRPASDPMVRVSLSKACDARIQVKTGNSGNWASGERENLHYKLLNPRGIPLSPARGPAPNATEWEPAHVPLDDDLTMAIYGGVWSRPWDWRHLDDLDVETLGGTSQMVDAAAWDCGGPFTDSGIPLGGLELVYGNTSNGWEMATFRVEFEGSTYIANLSTEYPKFFATYDTPEAVFLDYNADCHNFSHCQSDWYMRFKFAPSMTTCGDAYYDETWSSQVDLMCAVRVHESLTITPGTNVTAHSANSSVIVLPGARLIAVGTLAEPITFRAPNYETPGTWSGVTLLGRASEPFNTRIGGYAYGSTQPDSADSSGIMSYVRIYGAVTALNLAGVGKGTIVNHIEIGFADDDGLLLEASTVDVNYVSVVSVGDDAIDLEKSYGGRLSRVFVLLDSTGDHALEVDGGVSLSMSLVTIISSSTDAAISFRSDLSQGSMLDKAIIVSQNPLEVPSCDALSLDIVTTSASQTCVTQLQTNVIAKLTTDFVLDEDFYIDPRSHVDSTLGGAFDKDPYAMWLDRWSILYELEKLDFYESLDATSTTPNPAPTSNSLPPTTKPTLKPTPRPTSRPTPRPTPRPTLGPAPLPPTIASGGSASSSKKSSSKDNTVQTATVSFLAGLLVGIIVVLATYCFARRHPRFAALVSMSGSNQVPQPSFGYGRYDALGVELINSPENRDTLYFT